MLVQCSQPYRIISDGNKTRLIIPGCNKPFAKEVGFGHKLRGLQINAWRNMDNEKDLEYTMLTYSGKPISTSLCSRVQTMVEDEFDLIRIQRIRMRDMMFTSVTTGTRRRGCG
jgi:hypothetical protein